MTRRDRRTGARACAARTIGLAAAAWLFGASPAALAADLTVTPQQRGTAQAVAQNGVPLAELAANAPDVYTVRPRDTLWDISKLFLRSPWRWPELWGMNLQQIRNPHLIYPGQTLYLDKSDGRARLRLGQAPGSSGTVRLSPRVRGTELGDGALPSIPFHLIEPFLNDALVFQANELESVPRIVATQENRVLLGRGDTAYVRGDLTAAREYRIFRKATPLRDPANGELLGYEARDVGAAEYTRQGGTRVDAAGRSEVVPATFVVTNVRQEAGIGDRLAVVPVREFTNYAPHAPEAPMDGQIASLYGDALTAGQNQIVALNRGANAGIERGHVLTLLRDGARTVDTTDPARAKLKLPDESNGLLFVFRVFDRVSYALILSAGTPVKPGDHFKSP
jgi:LysM domain